jgi:hypothetical protein
LIKLIIFWLKYKRTSLLTAERYNEGIKHSQKLELNDLFVYLNGSELDDMDKLKSLYEKIGEFEILTHIASCVIEPRFKKWKASDRLKYCKDINRSINLAFSLSGFFLFNFGLRHRSLGTYLMFLGKKTK